MSFQWPTMLWFLLAVPLLVAGYILLLRRRKKNAVKYASLTMIKDAMGPGAKIRRHIPPALFLVSGRNLGAGTAAASAWLGRNSPVPAQAHVLNATLK